MIKHDSGACISVHLPYGMTNTMSMQRSMKVDTLSYFNLHSISKLHCLLPPVKMYSLRSLLMNAACRLAPQPAPLLACPTDASAMSFE